MDYKDYYKILGISPTASDAEIKSAYRRLARKYHPDVSKEPDAEAKFKDVGEAYEILKDGEKRAAFDQLRQYGGSGPGPGFRPGAGSSEDLGSIFETLFGGMGQGGRRAGGFSGLRGEDAHAAIQVSLKDAFAGAQKTLQLTHAGKPRSLRVKIPAGVTDGQVIRLAGQGSTGFGGGQAGDLLLTVSIQPEPGFELQGRDLIYTLPVAPWEVALGAAVDTPTMAGNVELKIPAGSQSGTRLRLRGRGLPGKPAGNQYVVLKVIMPLADSEEKKQFYRDMAEQMGFDPRKK